MQASHGTAKLLIKAGKERWISAREDTAFAKGKGAMRTLWVNPQGQTALPEMAVEASSNGTEEITDESNDPVEQLKHTRLVDWMVKHFQEHIREVVAHHDITHKKGREPSISLFEMVTPGANRKIALDEVAEIVNMPSLDATAVTEAKNVIGSVQLSPKSLGNSMHAHRRLLPCIETMPFTTSSMLAM